MAQSRQHEVIDEKIAYLRKKSKFIKGLKMNFSDTFLSQIEAVFSRGTEN
jgi:hypothetical protein